MLKTPSKVLMYISSYFILYPLLIIKIISTEHSEKMSIYENVVNRIKSQRILIIVLFALMIVSVIWIQYIKKIKCNTRINSGEISNKTLDILLYLIPYIFTMITLDINVWGVCVNIALFLILGIALIASNKVCWNPTLLIFRYKIYSVNNKYLLSRDQKEQLRLRFDEMGNIPVREICRNVYISNDI